MVLAGTVTVGTKSPPPVPPLTSMSSQGPAPGTPQAPRTPVAGVVLGGHVGDSRELCWVWHLIPQEARAPSDTSVPSATSPCAQQVIKKSRFPHWDEVLEVELPEGELGEAVLKWRFETGTLWARTTSWGR